MDSGSESNDPTITDVDRDEDAVQLDDDRSQRRRKAYTMHFKLQVIREAKATTRIAAAKKFGVDRKRVPEWLSNEDKILAAPRSKRRINGGGRKPPHNAIDDLVVE